MARTVFDRETLLDLTVNIIPLGILLFFVVLYTVYTPFGWDPVITTLMYGLHVVPFVGLAVLTYFAGRAISRAEGEAERAAEIDDDFERRESDGEDRKASADVTEGVSGDAAEIGPENDDDAEAGTNDEPATGGSSGETDTAGDGGDAAAASDDGRDASGGDGDDSDGGDSEAERGGDGTNQ
jgi:hypothetical protein